MMRITQRLRLTALLCILPFIFACSQSNEPIKIGAILPLTGSASHHADIANGINLAIDEINRYGGIDGHPLEMRLLDNETSPEAAKQAFAKLEAEYRPHFYISSTSFISLPLAPLAEESGVVLVGLIAAAPEVTANRDWVFRYYATLEDEISPTLRTLSDKGIKRLGVIHMNDAVGTALYNNLKQRFGAAGGEIFAQPFEASVKNYDFSKEVAALSHLEAIHVVGYETHTIAVLKELLKTGYQGLKLSGSSAANLPSISPELNEVYISASSIYDTKNSAIERVAKHYDARFNQAFTLPAAMGYDFVHLLSSLLQSQKAFTRRDIRDVLMGQFSHSGVFGHVNKEAGNHNIGFPTFETQIIDGRLIYLQ